MLQPIQSEALARHGHIAHGFFGRQGGVSEGIYAALNCGLGSKDARAVIRENRRRVADRLGAAPDHLLTAHQHHSADAIVVTEPWTFETMPKADALVTATRGIAVGSYALPQGTGMISSRPMFIMYDIRYELHPAGW